MTQDELFAKRGHLVRLDLPYTTVKLYILFVPTDYRTEIMGKWLCSDAKSTGPRHGFIDSHDSYVGLFPCYFPICGQT